MNVFEAEIAKYERRLDRIERNPSSAMLSSNRLLYQAQLEHNRQLLKAWRDGKTFIGCGSPWAMLMRSLGDFEILNLIRIADRLGTEHAEASIEKVRAMGLPDYACDRTILFLPLALMADQMPKPSIIVSSTGGCDVINDTHRTLAKMLDVPVYTFDVPFEDPYKEHLGYVVKQLEGLIEWVEATIPGAKYDEGKLAELQKSGRRWSRALRDIYELRQRIPCPDHPRDVFREPMWPAQFADPTLLIQYFESYRDELRARAERGWAAVGEEKLRIVWSITGPYGSGVWDFLAGRGVSVPYWHFGVAERIFINPAYGDDSEFGRKLTPLEEEARILLRNSWGGSAERWIKDTVLVCREFQADGLVQFEQTGCQPVLGLGQFVARRLEEELGIPSWCVEGRQLLGHTERAEAEFMAGLEAFINLCLERKKSGKRKNPNAR